MFRVLLVAILCVVAFTKLAPRCLEDTKPKTKQNVALKILRRDWKTHRVIAHIADILLREELEYDVEIVDYNDKAHLPTPETTRDYQWASEGRIDMNLEVFRTSEKKPYYDEWVGQGQASHLGDHRVKSYSGIYTPKYVVEDEPRAEFYSFYQDQGLFGEVTNMGSPAADKSGLCRSPKWNCTKYVWRPNYCGIERGNLYPCQAQVVHGPLGWEQGLLEQKIRNNEWNSSVAYTTTDEREWLVWDAITNRQPILFYNWEPNHYPIYGLPSKQFTRVKFIPTSEQETAVNDCPAPGSDPTGRARCETPPAPVQKIVSPKLASSPDARHFVVNFVLNEKDYAEIFEALESKDGKPADAACEWLRWKGREVWGMWAKYTPPYVPMEALTRTRLQALNPRNTQDLESASASISSNQISSNPLSVQCKETYGITNRFRETIQGESASAFFQSIMRSGKLTFLWFRRDEKNFMAESGAFMAPNFGSDVFRMHTGPMKFGALLWHLLTNAMKESVCVSIQYLLAVGAIATFANIIHVHADLNFFDANHWIYTIGSKMNEVVHDFTFLPSILVVFKLVWLMDRWRTWVNNAGAISGRLLDIALVIGALDGINDPDGGERLRQLQFTFYRYLNLTHVLTYVGIDYRIPTNPAILSDLLVRTGLLLQEEQQKFVDTASGGMHTNVMTWMSHLWQTKVPKVQADPYATIFTDKLMKLRVMVGCLRTHTDFNREPDVTDGMLQVIVSALLFLVLICYPFHFHSPYSGCFQPWAMIHAWIIIISYHGLLTMCQILSKSPTDPDGECVNTDNLLIGTEEMLFSMIRANHQPLDSPNPILDSPNPILEASCSQTSMKSDSCDMPDIAVPVFGQIYLPRAP